MSDRVRRCGTYLFVCAGLVVLACLAAAPAWTTEGNQASALLGGSVATAGDVNGDGYADVIVGVVGYDNGEFNEGRAFLYEGGGGGGAPLRPRQSRADLSAPIAPGGRAYQNRFGLGPTLRSPMGSTGLRRLQWQTALWRGTLSPYLNPYQSDGFWFAAQDTANRIVSFPYPDRRYIWRARVQYAPSQSPFVAYSRWFTISGNSLHEADLFSTSQPPPPPCVAPDEEIYIENVTLDINGKPVLHSMDANQPSGVTGYNIYRSSSPTGAWTLIGSNVVDMDQGTPNNQYVDQTGDVGGPWYYQIAAFNGACGVEGPW